jgi:SAM-dependent methyltransferase
VSLDAMLDEIGREWRVPPSDPASKMAQRLPQLRAKWRLVERHLPDYARHGGRDCLDVSSGGGALLEILRYHGHRVLGVDVGYLDLLESQAIPYVVHDCTRLPLPLADGSHDLVTCAGAISCYALPWESVLAEFCRIARRTVLVVANHGEVLDASRAVAESWQPAGWRLARTVADNAFRWDRR